MRIMQIGNSHADYLAMFTRRFKKLTTHAEMMRAYVDDYYWCSHTYIPALERMGHETFLCVPMEFVSQRMWCQEHGVAWDEEAPFLTVLEQIKWFQPDILYIGSASMYHDALLQYLPYRPGVIMGWHATVTHPHMQFSLYDAILSSHEECLYIAKEQGARNVAFTYPGIPAELGDMFPRQKRSDVCFSGYWAVSHPRRNAFLAQLAERVPSLGVDCAYHIGYYRGGPPLPDTVMRLNRGGVWGKSMFRAFAAARIVLNGFGQLNFGVQNLSPNMRQLEGMGAGSFMLSENSDNLEAFFEENKDMATFASIEEMVDKIHYYLEHEDEREAIAAHGLATCRRYYNMDVRARALLDVAARVSAAPPPPLEVQMRTLSAVAQGYTHNAGAGLSADMQTLATQGLATARRLLLSRDAAALADGARLMDVLTALPLTGVRDTALCRGLLAMKSGDDTTAWRCMQEELDAFPENDMARQSLSTMALRRRGLLPPQREACPPVV